VKKIIFIAVCAILGISLLNYKPKSDYDINPCDALKKSTPKLDTREGQDMDKKLTDEVSELVTSTYGAQQVGKFEGNSYTTCSWGKDDVVGLRVISSLDGVIVEGKYANIDNTSPFPLIVGKVWVKTIKLDPEVYPNAYKSVKKLFANHNPAND
jgi:hypothetical protein